MLILVGHVDEAVNPPLISVVELLALRTECHVGKVVVETLLHVAKIPLDMPTDIRRGVAHLHGYSREDSNLQQTGLKSAASTVGLRERGPLRES
jgi:hypothetical protein